MRNPEVATQTRSDPEDRSARGRGKGLGTVVGLLSVEVVPVRASENEEPEEDQSDHDDHAEDDPSDHDVAVTPLPRRPPGPASGE